MSQDKTTARDVLQALRNDLVRDEYNPGGMFYAELEAPSEGTLFEVQP